MGILRSLFGRSSNELEEPDLEPETLERWRRLRPSQRQRLFRDAEQEARESLKLDATRDFATERDAFIELELSGTHARVLEVAKREAESWSRRAEKS
jgi:hypothetical protein